MQLSRCQTKLDVSENTVFVLIQNGLILNKYVRLREQTFIHTCRSYTHMPCKLDRLWSHNSLKASHHDSSNFGLMGEHSKVPQNGRFPAQDADELPWL